MLRRKKTAEDDPQTLHTGGIEIAPQNFDDVKFRIVRWTRNENVRRGVEQPTAIKGRHPNFFYSAFAHPNRRTPMPFWQMIKGRGFLQWGFLFFQRLSLPCLLLRGLSSAALHHYSGRQKAIFSGLRLPTGFVSLPQCIVPAGETRLQEFVYPRRSVFVRVFLEPEEKINVLCVSSSSSSKMACGPCLK